MATTQNKRPIRRTQPARPKQLPFTIPRSKPFKFHKFKGKLVEEIFFASEPGFEAVSIIFKDKTRLNFIIEAGFTLKPTYSGWEGGEEQILRAWPPLKSLKS